MISAVAGGGVINESKNQVKNQNMYILIKVEYLLSEILRTRSILEFRFSFQFQDIFTFIMRYLVNRPRTKHEIHIRFMYTFYTAQR